MKKIITILFLSFHILTSAQEGKGEFHFKMEEIPAGCNPELLKKIIDQNNEILNAINQVNPPGCLDPQDVTIKNYRSNLNCFIGSDSTGQGLLLKFVYKNQRANYNIIISDTAEGWQYPEPMFNVWIEYDHWWIKKYMLSSEIEYLISCQGMIMEVDQIRMMEESKNILKEGIIINMIYTIRNAISRSRKMIYSNNGDFLHLMEHWNSWD